MHPDPVSAFYDEYTDYNQGHLEEDDYSNWVSDRPTKVPSKPADAIVTHIHW